MLSDPSNEIEIPASAARRCTDLRMNEEHPLSLIASASTARVDAAISAVERIALDALSDAGYGAEDIADVRLLLDALREEMAAVFARR